MITWDGESRDDLVKQLAAKYLMFERDYKVPVDSENAESATLKGKIRLLSRIRGDRQAMAEAKVLKLVKRDRKWFVEKEALKKALAKAEKE